MLRTIHLHGRLKKKFGPSFTLDCASFAEAMRALVIMVPGFRAEMEKGQYRVRMVDKRGRFDLEEEMLRMNIGAGTEHIHVTPVATGAKNRGVAKVIIGLAIIAVAIFAPPLGGALFATTASGAVAGLTVTGMVVAVGAAVALSGVAMMMAPTPGVNIGDREKDPSSFLFNGAQNTNEQGGPVPLCYGEHVCGSVVASAGITAADVMGGGGWVYNADPAQTATPPKGYQPAPTADPNYGSGAGTSPGADHGSTELRNVQEQ